METPKSEVQYIGRKCDTILAEYMDRFHTHLLELVKYEKEIKSLLDEHYDNQESSIDCVKKIMENSESLESIKIDVSEIKKKLLSLSTFCRK